MQKLIFITYSFMVLASCQGVYYPPRSELVSNNSSWTVKTIQEENKKFLRNEELKALALTDFATKRWIQQNDIGDYVIGKKDTVNFKFLPDPTLNKRVEISNSGVASFALIGGVSIKDRTINSLKEELDNRYSNYYNSPQSTISVVSQKSEKVTLSGSFNDPGVFTLSKAKTNLVEAMSLGSGMKSSAANYLVLTPRQGINKRIEGSIEIPLFSNPVTLPFDVLDIPIQADDVLLLPQAGKVSIHGEVKVAQTVDIEPGMTVIGALTAAGGITPDAEFKEVELHRQEFIYFFDLENFLNKRVKDIAIRDGDVIIVPTNSGRRASNATINMIVELTQLGVGASYETQ